MRTNRSFIKTYLASMKIGATIIYFTRTFVIFFLFLSQRYIYLCFEGTIGRLTSVVRAVLKAGWNEGGCC